MDQIYLVGPIKASLHFSVIKTKVKAEKGSEPESNHIYKSLQEPQFHLFLILSHSFTCSSADASPTKSLFLQWVSSTTWPFGPFSSFYFSSPPSPIHPHASGSTPVLLFDVFQTITISSRSSTQRLTHQMEKPNGRR